MRVRATNRDGDFTFGQSKANYKERENAIIQNVITRVKSFKHDWFLDTEAVIGWWQLLGEKNTKTQILHQVEEAVAGTYGVTKITSLDATVSADRVARIELSYLTIYNNEVKEEIII